MIRFLATTALSLSVLFSMVFAQNPLKTNKSGDKVSQFVTATYPTTQTQQTPKPYREIKTALNATGKTLAAQLRIAETYASADPNKTVIKLIVEDSMWMDGSGYQILLDSKHAIYDEFFDPQNWIDQEKLEDLYLAADIKIPTEATPDWTDGHSVLDGQQDSAIIEPGVYDMFVVLPAEHPYGTGPFVYPANSEVTALNDFLFVAGYTYVFTVFLDMENKSDGILFKPPFDLAVQQVILPSLFGCDLENPEIKIEIKNQGQEEYTEPILAFYTVAGTTDTVKETISTPLKSDSSFIYTFTVPASFKTDTTSLLIAGITEKGGFSHNNYASKSVFKHDPFTAPYAISLDKMNPLDPAAWSIQIQDTTALSVVDNVPLFSPCFDMQAGKRYRIIYEYLSGFDFVMFVLDGHHAIQFGQTSQNWQTWDTITSISDDNVYSLKRNEVIVQPEEDGTYAFCFITYPNSTGPGSFWVKNIRVEKIMDYDISLNEFSTGLARLMPVEQANTTFRADLIIENRGDFNIDTATIVIDVNGEEASRKDVFFGKPGMTSMEFIEFTLSDLSVDDTVNITAKVAVKGHEEEDMTDNNEKHTGFIVTQSLMAYDRVVDSMYKNENGIGQTQSIGCGIPFKVYHKDTLTAVSVGWSEMEKDQDIQITIHQWDAANETLGRLLFETTAPRGTEAGQREYEMPAIILEAGDYMISVVQLGSRNYELITDRSADGFLYITTVSPLFKQSDMGFPAIRAVFGQNGKPRAKDITVKQILKPDGENLFSANEEVVFRIANLGYEKVKAPVNITINNTLCAAGEIELEGYTNVLVSLGKLDLSEGDTEYDIAVFTSLADDEDRSNDTCRKTVYCMPIADPYIMDFEYTPDFSISNFNPTWTTLDLDGVPTYTLANYTFPHATEPFAFIAFNPDRMTPPASGDVADYFAQNNTGMRFGASFSPHSGIKNDWLISPKLTLPAQSPQMSFIVKTYTTKTSTSKIEKYKVLISGTDNKPESFVAIGETREAPKEWQEVTVDLKDYAGKSVHLAIQCVSEDAFIFMIDDIVISKPTANEGDQLSTQLNLYPNPVREMVAIHSSDAAIRQVSIFNLSGSQVYQSADNLNTEMFRYSVKGLSAGIYFARIKTDQGISVMKFIVR